MMAQFGLGAIGLLERPVVDAERRLLQARGLLGVAVGDGPLEISPREFAAHLVHRRQGEIRVTVVRLVAGGDLVVADDDGAVVIPRALATEVAAAGAEQERFERYVQLRVRAGASVFGLYPPDANATADYDAWRAAGEPDTWPGP